MHPRRSTHAKLTAGWDVLLSEAAAKDMAAKLEKFILTYRLVDHISHMTPGHLLALCIFLSRLSWQPGAPIQLSANDTYTIPKPTYTPASHVDINVPSPPFFAQQFKASVTEHRRPHIQPPQVCPLCGKGFVSMDAWHDHCRDEHCGLVEARKRLFYEAEQLDAIPCAAEIKRRFVQNFAFGPTHSRPVQGHFGTDKACQRQLVACAVCALVDWIDDMYPCYLFKDCPETLKHVQDDLLEDAESEDSDAEPTTATQHHASLLKDEDGYYVDSAEKIHDLLDVERYIRDWPLIPKQELYASSIQHPRYPEYRWLLNTRRAPVRARAGEEVTPSGTATEHATDHEQAHDPQPICAGVGDPNKAVWLCDVCKRALCRRQPSMPFFALANWCWGGRVHPAFQELPIAMRLLLNIGRPLMRLIVLQHSENEEDQEKGLVGNTILLAQPHPKAVLQHLPPSMQETQEYFSVVFKSAASANATSTDIRKQKAFTIDRDKYLKCTRIRSTINPVYADVDIDAPVLATEQDAPENAAATERTSIFATEDGVPRYIMETAVPLDTLDTFHPPLDGPASMKASTCLLPTTEADVTIEDDGDHESARNEECDANDLTQLPAEFLIAVNEDNGDDDHLRMLAFRRQLEVVDDHARKMCDFQRQKQEALEKGPRDDPSAMLNGSRVAAEKSLHKESLVDLHQIAKGMGEKWEATMEAAITAVEHTAKPRTLHVQTGKPLDMFSGAAWSASFVDFLWRLRSESR